MKYALLHILLWLCITHVSAQDFPDPMVPPRLVNDYTQLLSKAEQNRLEEKLQNFNDTTSTQISVATVPSLNGYEANDYAQRLAEKWGVGQQGKNNGILLLVKPKTRTEKGQVAIAVGYGLEGAVPDAIASRIIRNEIIPEFQNDRYYDGINKATNILMKLTSGEYSTDQYGNDEWGEAIFTGIFVVIFLLIILFSRFKSKGKGSGPFIFWGSLGGGLSGGSSSGNRGFGGFRGGSFGGGGASGSW
ncbi:TPM domain-containing protein [Odoribacter lunatus]|uniref:TPM domain-containing protein n=1 Tax=Odoribacter lunatus TaxID=2941335 RepID=UPI00203BF97B|nr:TPM domain-containing protein [Odoribacter lunatus]